MPMRRALLALLIALPGAAPAQQADAPGVSIELNALGQDATGCQISFVIRNGHEADIASAVYEAVLFDTDGRVDRLTLFDFGALPAGRPRVRQFVLPDLACDSLGGVLVNGAETCSGDGLPPGACIDGLDLRSRTDVEMLG